MCHEVHVKYNPDSGSVEGLPPEWVKMLKEANISKNEQKKNPQAVVQAIDFYEHNIKDNATHAKFLKKHSLEDDDEAPPPPPPKHATVSFWRFSFVLSRFFLSFVSVTVW